MQTLGQYRVGASFNPSGSSKVDQIKAKAAELIDLISSITDGEDDGAASPERMRLKALAMTDVESAAMWAVKAETKGQPD